MAASSHPSLPDQDQHYSIPGLVGETEFITEERERRIVNYLDQREWLPVTPDAASSRRVQQFGYAYGYNTKSVSDKPVSPLETDILEVALYLQKTGWLPEGKLQCIVNEYTRNQGISPHIDSPQFGPIVVTISLLENSVMIFTHKNDGRSEEVYLPRRGILVLEGEARYDFKHSIASKVNYFTPSGQKVTKGQDYRRISLTYRTVSDR